MSKRSYRRLAAVTGAALVLGGMAPAMAAQVSGSGTASASVDPGINITDVNSALPEVRDLVPPALVPAVLGSVRTTAHAAPALVVGDVFNIIDDALDVTGGALDASVFAGAGAHAGPGGVTVGLGSVVSAPVEIVAGSGLLVGDALGTAHDVAGLAAPVVFGTARLAAGTAFGVARTVPGTAASLLSLSDILGASASGNVNVGASLMGIL